MSGCLDGGRVLELARFQAGPRGGMILSDLGAEVQDLRRCRQRLEGVRQDAGELKAEERLHAREHDARFDEDVASITDLCLRVDLWCLGLTLEARAEQSHSPILSVSDGYRSRQG